VTCSKQGSQIVPLLRHGPTFLQLVTKLTASLAEYGLLYWQWI